MTDDERAYRPHEELITEWLVSASWRRGFYLDQHSAYALALEIMAGQPQALLDALGHGDCHPAAPGPVGFRENEVLARAEQAERERDEALRPRCDNRKCSSCTWLHPVVCDDCGATTREDPSGMSLEEHGCTGRRAALSADADADAGTEHDPYGVAGPCEPEPCGAPSPGGDPLVCECPARHAGTHKAQDSQGWIRWWPRRESP